MTAEPVADAAGFLRGFADAIDGFTADVRGLEVPADVAAGHAQLMATLDGIASTIRGAVDRIEAGEQDVEQAGGDPEAFVAEEIGESTTVGPGGQAVLNAELVPGTYAMLCFVSTADGTPHAALGMAREFTVE